VIGISVRRLARRSRRAGRPVLVTLMARMNRRRKRLARGCWSFPTAPSRAPSVAEESKSGIIDTIRVSKNTGIRKLRFDLDGTPQTDDGGIMLCGGVMEFLLEPLLPPEHLFIIGGGHCGVELSRLAKHVGLSGHCD